MKKLIKETFIATLPILFGYLFAGIAFGILCQSHGFNLVWNLIICVIVYSGSMQFVLLNLLISHAGPIEIAIATLVVNFRHIVYGISFIKLFDKMKKMGVITKPYMIYSLSDEVYAFLSSIKIPKGVNRKKFYIAISVTAQLYWFASCLLGGILGNFITFNTSGIEFVMTALFTVIFMDLLRGAKSKTPSFIGILGGLIGLIVFGDKGMLVSAIALVLGYFILNKKNVERHVFNAVRTNE
ncbi:MAG: AzlC family ABC transporter permease [Fusobacteriaceae bacterium]|jgi:4-azaleucine resistance transporter AzlC|nr:AzlC family ABC transporter permease [Fusobacteriaceae bacterium]